MQPLADIKVLDLSWHVAGPYCTKLLSDYGADVIKVERPAAGDPARAYGPFPGDEPNAERSGTFLHLNTNKRSVTVNLKNEAGKLIVKELTRWADVIVENFSPGTLEDLGLGYGALKVINPGLVMCSITNYGQTGPHRDWKATEFTLTADSGLLYVQGIDEREPLKHADHLQEYQGGSMGSMAIMGAVLHRRRSGVGQCIDVSIHEVASNSADRRATMLTGYAYTGVPATREAPIPTTLPVGIYPCADGYVYLVASPTARWPRFMDMIGRRDLWDDPDFNRDEFWAEPEAKDRVDALMYPWLMERSKQEIMEAAQKSKVPGTAVNSTVEILEDPHLKARAYWVEADHPEAGRLPYVGPSIRKAGGGWLLKRTAPLLGQHNEEVLSGFLGLSPAELVLLREQGAI